MIKNLLLILLFLFFTACDTITSPEDTSNSRPKVIFNSPHFQITPTGTITEKINDSIYIAKIENQWQTFERLNATFDYVYSGIGCRWEAESKTTVTYSYGGQVFTAPIINNSSYFVGNKSSTMVSFYKEFLNDTICIGAAVLSENADELYVDLIYFIVKSKN